MVTWLVRPLFAQRRAHPLSGLFNQSDLIGNCTTGIISESPRLHVSNPSAGCISKELATRNMTSPGDCRSGGLHATRPPNCRVLHLYSSPADLLVASGYQRYDQDTCGFTPSQIGADMRSCAVVLWGLAVCFAMSATSMQSVAEPTDTLVRVLPDAGVFKGETYEVHRVRVEGVAVDSDGEPIVNATVMAVATPDRRPSGFQQTPDTASSDADGRFALAVEVLVLRDPPRAASLFIWSDTVQALLPCP